MARFFARISSLAGRLDFTQLFQVSQGCQPDQKVIQSQPAIPVVDLKYGSRTTFSASGVGLTLATAATSVASGRLQAELSSHATRARSKCHPLAKRSVARINASVMPGLLAACPASFTTTNSERGHRLCRFHAPASGA